MKLKLILLLLSCSFLFSNDEPRKHVIGPWNSGLGSCFLGVLNHLMYCERYNKIPLDHWNSHSLYYNPHGFNGQDNVWRYYFKPLSSLKYKKGDIINYSYNPSSISDEERFYYFKTSDEKRAQAAKLIGKYIKFNEIVQKKIDDFYNQHMAGHHVISIHLRGTDKKFEEALVSPQKIINEALKYAQPNSVFLLASDEQRLLDSMIQLLKGKKVIYYHCYRSDNGKALHIRSKPSFSQLGEDMAVEWGILAKSNMFIHTLSNVSAAILYLNPTLQHVTVVA